MLLLLSDCSSVQTVPDKVIERASYTLLRACCNSGVLSKLITDSEADASDRA